MAICQVLDFTQINKISNFTQQKKKQVSKQNEKCNPILSEAKQNWIRSWQILNPVSIQTVHKGLVHSRRRYVNIVQHYLLSSEKTKSLRILLSSAIS